MMNKILIAIVAVLVATTTADAGNKHRRSIHNHGGEHHDQWHGNKHYHGDGHNYWHGGHNNYWHGGNNNYYYGGGNNFYQDPNFWGGVAGGLIGGALLNGIQNDQQDCREVVTQVYVDGIGYRQGTVVVCD